MGKLKFIFFIFFCFFLSICYSLDYKEALYWQVEENGNVRCALCPRRCVIGKGDRGFCGVRINREGKLYTLAYNNPVAIAVDPIEKKPFFHVLPGTGAFSLAIAGCNMRCLFCQNWHISQAKPDETINYTLSSADIVRMAKKYNCPSVVFTYTEPTVFYEYMLETAKLAKQEGLLVGMHSCGYINEEPLGELLMYMDFINVDLKSFSPDFYREMSNGADLNSVLITLKKIKEANVHLEITNLVIPTKNDSAQEVKKLCLWIRDNLGIDTPVHFSRFFPHYRLNNLPPTPVSTLKDIYNIAKQVGLRFVYIGNVPGIEEESTYCPKCNNLLIKRVGYSILENNIRDGKCKFCGEAIPGIWE
ncbi:MAG: AmmeMemoRadiSam system radical SAM enzyme [Candidatus Omnitrophica bacterium]|nr:AmmeMemoRadiSam system radical SAM enzyme [Candidatus Omnitrophota bacterium]